MIQFEGADGYGKVILIFTTKAIPLNFWPLKVSAIYRPDGCIRPVR